MSAPATSRPANAVNDREPFSPRDWILFVAVGLIWGSSFLLISIGLKAFHPGLITWARVGLGALALSVLPSARRAIDRADGRRILALSIIWVAIPFTLFPLAQQHINSAVTGLLNGATPIFAGIIGGLFFARPPRGPQRIGLGLGFLGIAIVSVASGGDGGSTAAIGVLMVLAATVCYGVATNFAGPIQQRYGSIPVMARMLVLATVWTAPFGLVGVARSDFSVGPAVAITVLGVVGTGVAFALMAELVGSVGGPRASIITHLIPIVSLGLGVGFLGDDVSTVALGGVVLVLSGAALISRRER